MNTHYCVFTHKITSRAGILRNIETSNPNMPCFSCHTLIRWGIWADSVSKPPSYWGWEAKRRVTMLPLIYMNLTWMWSTTTGATVVWKLPCPASEKDFRYISGGSSHQVTLAKVVGSYSFIPFSFIHIVRTLQYSIYNGLVRPQVFILTKQEPHLIPLT